MHIETPPYPAGFLLVAIAVFLPHYAADIAQFMAGATMASLVTLQKRRDELSAAIQSGALSVRHGEKQVTYRSLSEMRSTLASLDDEIAALSGARRRTKQLRIKTSRGT